ncbi:nuclear transport factor 2 family protein [Rubrivirga sp.]|uniref:nuclear transport factor 2 family protein n=1 Tax=Rubrivirga sp. TaxID=1885344 RepID=UPI003C755AFB
MWSGEGRPVWFRLFVDGESLMGQVNDDEASRLLYQGDRAFRPEAEPAALISVLEDGALVAETPDGLMDGTRIGNADLSTSGPLYDVLLEADRALFETIFVDCDADRVVEWLDEDVEFCHDEAGLSVGTDVYAEIHALTESCPRANGMTREVDVASLSGSPIEGFEAVQTGTHRFTEGSSVTVAQFAHVWRETPDGWRIRRAISYDHRPDSD